MKNKNYFLYALIKSGKPVYVGVTNNLKRRDSEHKRKRKIDYDFIFKIEEFDNKKDALKAESSLIKFNGIFRIGLKNAPYAYDDFHILSGVIKPMCEGEEVCNG